MNVPNALLVLAGVTILLVLWLQCDSRNSNSSYAYAESYDSTLSLPDREFVNQIIDPPREFDTVKLQTYSTSLQTGGNWGRGCECNFARPSDGRGFQITGYY